MASGTLLTPNFHGGATLILRDATQTTRGPKLATRRPNEGGGLETRPAPPWERPNNDASRLSDATDRRYVHGASTSQV